MYKKIPVLLSVANFDLFIVCLDQSADYGMCTHTICEIFSLACQVDLAVWQ